MTRTTALLLLVPVGFVALTVAELINGHVLCGWAFGTAAGTSLSLLAGYGLGWIR